MSKIEDISEANINKPNVLGAQYRLRVENVRPKLDISVGGQWQNVSSNDQIDSGKWVMITATWDGSIQRIYINGNLNLENSVATDGGIDNLTGGDLMIGKGWHPSSGLINGSIDDVRIYNRALSEAEVAALYEFENKPVVNEPVPSLSNFTPVEGSDGSEVVVTGEHLTKVTGVWLGETAVSQFSASSDDRLVFTVPANAKSGKIRLVSGKDSVVSNDTFEVTESKVDPDLKLLISRVLSNQDQITIQAVGKARDPFETVELEFSDDLIHWQRQNFQLPINLPLNFPLHQDVQFMRVKRIND